MKNIQGVTERGYHPKLNRFYKQIWLFTDYQKENDPIREADEAVHRPEAHEERLAPRRRDLHRGPQDGAVSHADQSATVILHFKNKFLLTDT